MSSIPVILEQIAALAVRAQTLTKIGGPRAAEALAVLDLALQHIEAACNGAPWDGSMVLARIATLDATVQDDDDAADAAGALRFPLDDHKAS